MKGARFEREGGEGGEMEEKGRMRERMETNKGVHVREMGGGVWGDLWASKGALDPYFCFDFFVNP